MAFGDDGRLLGERSIAAGSLHVDEWRCNAADLADRNAIAVFPVGGWWKTNRDRTRNNASMRYALVIPIHAGDVAHVLWLQPAIPTRTPDPPVTQPTIATLGAHHVKIAHDYSQP